MIEAIRRLVELGLKASKWLRDAEDTLDARRGRAASRSDRRRKSWTLISGMLKRSMKSVKLHAKTLRRVGAKKPDWQKSGLKAKAK